MLNSWRIFILGGLTAFSLVVTAAIPEITNFDAIAKSLKLKQFKGQKFSSKVKIAVIDNGFNGYVDELGKSLPQSTVYHGGKESDADKIETQSYHGLFMAQLVARIVQESGIEADYELHLYNAYGYTKFADAVDSVISEKIDIVLYSQVWEYGGNGDGKGFINALVNKATAAGVIWINAAGNFGSLTYLGGVDGKVDGGDEWVQFKDKKGKTAGTINVVCRAAAKKDKCGLRLVLSWNDFKDDPIVGTDKDLDLYLYDSANKKVLAASDRNQMLTADANDPKASIVPRELIEYQVNPGQYKVRVKVKSKNFSASQDQLRITASGTGVDLIPNTPGETLLPPADNPQAIVIGASDDVLTSESKKLGLPKVFFKSLVNLKGGATAFSTSNAAAMAAGLAVLSLGTGTEKTKDAIEKKLLEFSKGKGSSAKAQNIRDEKPVSQAGDEKISVPVRTRPHKRRPSESAGAPPREGGQDQGQGQGQGETCQPLRQQPVMYPTLKEFLNRGGALLVNLRGLPAISVNYNYFAFYGLQPRPGQRSFMTPNGIALRDQSELAAYGLPANSYAIVPSSVSVCSLQ